MFSFPEKYDAVFKGHVLSSQNLSEVEISSELFSNYVDPIADFLTNDLYRDCKSLLPTPEKVDAKDAIEAFRYLKKALVALTLFIFS